VGDARGHFNSIPYFGPVVVAGGLFLVGLVQGGGFTAALQMSGAAIVITSLEGWLLTPPLMGKVERMNALTVFVGLLVWTWVWDACRSPRAAQTDPPSDGAVTRDDAAQRDATCDA
jgi:hypothetical protein